MKVKWKSLVARLFPAMTAVATLVLAIGAHTNGSVKWA